MTMKTDEENAKVSRSKTSADKSLSCDCSSEAAELYDRWNSEYDMLRGDLEKKMSALIDGKINELTSSDTDKSEAERDVREHIKSELNVFDAKWNSEFIKLTDRVRKLSTSVRSIEKNLDSLEQYFRRGTLLFHGIPYTPKEDTAKILIEFIATNLDIHITKKDAISIHRKAPQTGNDGLKAQDRVPMIICKFIHMNDRNKIYLAKMKLKKTKYAITEDLTDRRASLFQEIKNMNLVTWTFYGDIYIMDSQNRKLKVETIEKVKSHSEDFLSYGVDMISVKQ